MNFTKSVLRASSLSMLLCTSLLSNEVYNVKSGSLKESIDKILQISNMKYMGDTRILEGKIAPSIKDIKGLKNTLNKLLKGTNLKNIIKDDTIIIIEKNISPKTFSSNLGDFYIVEKINTTESTGSYTTSSMNTATKLNLSIRETPQSVTVITNQELEDKNITSLQGLLEHVTGVSLYRRDERLDTTARGFDIDYYKLDGIPRSPRVDARDDDLSIFDRIEIVRGANGLTTGSGNPGVSINLVRKRANSKEFKGSTSLSINSFGAASIEADISSKLNEEGNIRGRFLVKHQEGGTHLDDYETKNNLIYGVVAANLTDITTLSLGASWQTFDANNVRSGGLSAWDSNGDLINWDVTDHFSEDWTFTENVAKEVFLEIDQILYNNIKLNVDYLHSEFARKVSLLNFSGALDIDTGEGATYYTWKSEHLEVTDGLEVNADIPFTVGGLDQQIIVGVSFTKDQVKKYWSKNSYDPILDDFYSYDIDEYSYDIEENTAPSYTLQKAAFISGKFNFSEQIKLISGLRVSSWKYEISDGSKESRKLKGEVTPYIGLVYDLDNNHSIYTSYTSIFNPQEYKDKNANYLAPVTGESYEAGIKGEYFDAKLNASLSLFRIEQKGAAEVEGVRIDNPLLDAYVESEGVTSKGFEFDINGKITDRLDLGFGLSNFEAKNADGEKFNTKSSRTTANIFTKYMLNKDLTIAGGLRYKSKFYATGSTGTITQDAFFLANIMGNYKFNKNTSLQVNVENLFDKKYYVGITTSEYTYGSPRKISMNLQYTF